MRLHDATARGAPQRDFQQSLPQQNSPTHVSVGSALPTRIDPDGLTRLASKLAHEQGLSLLQMQSETLKVDTNHLTQRRSTLELRGDYASTKKLLIALLAKFPGLTLEHLTIRHHAGGAASDPASRSDDETRIELIQYARPSQVDS